MPVLLQGLDALSRHVDKLASGKSDGSSGAWPPELAEKTAGVRKHLAALQQGAEDDEKMLIQSYTPCKGKPRSR
eukprot:Skav209712  [mRNA]  locus=scaffold528:51967:53821:- [translate_table: standard]